MDQPVSGFLQRHQFDRERGEIKLSCPKRKHVIKFRARIDALEKINWHVGDIIRPRQITDPTNSKVPRKIILQKIVQSGKTPDGCARLTPDGNGKTYLRVELGRLGKYKEIKTYPCKAEYSSAYSELEIELGPFAAQIKQHRDLKFVEVPEVETPTPVKKERESTVKKTSTPTTPKTNQLDDPDDLERYYELRKHGMDPAVAKDHLKRYPRKDAK